MEADTFTAIGSTHRICQDSADRSLEAIVVADGCSSASNAEIGARLLTHILARNPYWDEIAILNYMRDLVQVGRLHKQNFYATLLRCVSTLDQFSVEVWGDGFVVAHRPNGTMRVIHIEFPSGAPAYLAYLLDDADTLQYLNQFSQGERVITTYEFDGTHFEVESVDHQIGVSATTFSFSHEEFVGVSLSTDGLQTFQEDWKVVLPQVFAFKNFNGEFVRRRLTAFLRNASKYGDDIGIASIRNTQPTRGTLL